MYIIGERVIFIIFLDWNILVRKKSDKSIEKFTEEKEERQAKMKEGKMEGRFLKRNP